MKGPKWLSEAVFYEIYPQSFYDSNADGVGDIAGIIEKLDYIKDLGCTALWLNPLFKSPFQDAGYDISDYYKVAPRYGTNEDLERLFAAAKEKDLKVILDLVPGHTSIENPWFKESARQIPNSYSNWYIWTDHWLEKGSAELPTVNGYGERNGNYVINFFYCQPALNYGFVRPEPGKDWQLPIDHPDVQAVRSELKNIIRFWLDKGADGFRVDMAWSLVKNDPGHAKTIEYWQEVRQMLDQDYPHAAFLAEWANIREAIEAGFHADFLLQFGDPMYTTLFRYEKDSNVDNKWTGNSFFRKEGRGDITAFLRPFLEQYRTVAERGYIALPSGNHDTPRISLKRNMRELKIAYTFIFTMPTIPFLYYGDEIGMNYLSDIPSKEGGYNRTGSRTPMQWSAEENAGFSSASLEKLYLPIDSRKSFPNLREQKLDEDSLWHFTRLLIKVRKLYKALSAEGEFYPLYAESKAYPFIYLRKMQEEQIFVAINPSERKTEARFSMSRLRGYGVKANWKSIKKLVELGDIDITVSSDAVRVKMSELSLAVLSL